MLVPRPQDMNTCHIADVMLHPHRDGLALSSATAMARCMSLTERAQSATRGTGKLDDVDGPVDQTPYQSDATDTSELIVSPAALLRQPAAKDLWPPAWAETRTELAECLIYFQERKLPFALKNGLVTGCLVGEVEQYGWQSAYIDHDTVIIRAGIPPLKLGDDRAQAECRRKRREVRHQEIIQSFRNNMIMRTPLVLILDRECIHCPEDLDQFPGRYCVLDHFLPTHIWRQPSLLAGNLDDLMVKFQLAKDAAFDFGHWMNNRAEYRSGGSSSRRVVSITCQTCGTTNEQVYAETWLCLNVHCARFFSDKSGRTAPLFLRFDRAWIERRFEGEVLPSSFVLSPDRAHYTELHRGKNLVLNHTGLQSLGKGQVCRKCHRCICRNSWKGYECPNCDDKLCCSAGTVVVDSYINDLAHADTGHPQIRLLCPPDYPQQQPIAGDGYRMDKVLIHGGATITLMTPTRTSNKVLNMDEIWTSIIDDANYGDLDLQRTMLRPDIAEVGAVTPYFHRTYGQAYDFSTTAPGPAHEHMPESVKNASVVLNHYGAAQLGPLWSGEPRPNSVQVLGFMPDMKLPWHRDGDGEIGPNTSMLMLGGDAELRIRIQLRHHIWAMQTEGAIRGAYKWQQVELLEQQVQDGSIDPEGAGELFDELTKNPTSPVEIALPLMHGSMVIIHGEEFARYYEYQVQPLRPLCAMVMTRYVDPDLHNALIGTYRQAGRRAGAKFTSRNGLWTDIPDWDDDSDDSVAAAEVDENYVAPEDESSSSNGVELRSRQPSPTSAIPNDGPLAVASPGTDGDEDVVESQSPQRPARNATVASESPSGPASTAITSPATPIAGRTPQKHKGPIRRTPKKSSRATPYAPSKPAAPSSSSPAPSASSFASAPRRSTTRTPNTKKSSSKPWSPTEDTSLLTAQSGGGQWAKDAVTSHLFPGRTAKALRERSLYLRGKRALEEQGYGSEEVKERLRRGRGSGKGGGRGRNWAKDKKGDELKKYTKRDGEGGGGGDGDGDGVGGSELGGAVGSVMKTKKEKKKEMDEEWDGDWSE